MGQKFYDISTMLLWAVCFTTAIFATFAYLFYGELPVVDRAFTVTIFSGILAFILSSCRGD